MDKSIDSKEAEVIETTEKSNVRNQMPSQTYWENAQRNLQDH